jgi:hypothetical protein
MPTATSGESSSAKPTPGDDEAASGLPRFDLRAAFITRQQQLLADLGLSRTVADHPGTLGDATELDWTGMLQAVLPSATAWPERSSSTPTSAAASNSTS